MKYLQRDPTFDITRSLCILWIVAYWHVRDNVSTSCSSEWILKAGPLVTMTVLGTFSFISGHFLSKYNFSHFSDALHFYKMRLKRFGIPFFIASTLLHVVSMAAGTPWYNGHLNYILSLFGLTVFFPPPPPTLWYLSTLVLFYLMTPLLAFRQNTWCRMIISPTTICLFVMLSHLRIVEDRVLTMLLMYILGLYLPDKVLQFLKRHVWAAICISCLLILVGDIFMSTYKLHTIIYIVFFGTALLFSLSCLLSKSVFLCLIGNNISYASLFMYLFHRHFLLSGLILFNIHSLGNVHQMVMPIWFAYGIIIPLMIVSCFYFQKIYDKILKKLTV